MATEADDVFSLRFPATETEDAIMKIDGVCDTLMILSTAPEMADDVGQGSLYFLASALKTEVDRLQQFVKEGRK